MKSVGRVGDASHPQNESNHSDLFLFFPGGEAPSPKDNGGEKNGSTEEKRASSPRSRPRSGSRSRSRSRSPLRVRSFSREQQQPSLKVLPDSELKVGVDSPSSTPPPSSASSPFLAKQPPPHTTSSRGGEDTPSAANAPVPKMQEAGIKQLINGPESFTPDGNFILGEAPELPGLYIGAGFNAYGIASGGGAGMALAEWVANGAPPHPIGG